MRGADVELIQQSVRESLTGQPRQPDSEQEQEAALACRFEVLGSHAPAYFITKFCCTIDEKKPGLIRPIVAFKYVLDYIRVLEDTRLNPKNLLVDKSRRMIATWITCGYWLWCLQYLRGFPGFMTSKLQPYVDDGGKESSHKSLFGRIRFMHNRLPEYVKMPVDFAYMRAVCEVNESIITGEAPTEGSGRAGGYGRALADEIAHVPHSELLHQSLGQACEYGKVYQSTPNGSQNVYGRLRKTLPDSWVLHTMDWKDHPEKARNLRREKDPVRISMYGPWTSDWFEEAVKEMTPDTVAQELNHSLEKSSKGLVYPEFDLDRNVSTKPFTYDPRLADAPGVGLDLGHARKNAAVFGQRHGRQLRVFGFYLGEHRDAGKNAGGLEVALRERGFNLPLDRLDLAPDPSSSIEEVGSGLSILSYYENYGFTSVTFPQVTGPNSVDLGIRLVRTMLINGDIIISCDLAEFIEFFGEYKYPVDRITGEIKPGDKPVHNMASHPMDALRYLVTALFSLDEILDALLDPMSSDVRVTEGPSAKLINAGEAGLLRVGGIRPGSNHLLASDEDEDKKEPNEDDDDDDWDDDDHVGSRMVTSGLQGARF